MPRTFAMPELAESVVEGEIVAWLVAEGDPVALDQPLVEVMTDKVTVEIPSPFAGVLLERLAAEGDVVPVGGPLARYEAEGGGEAEDGGATGAADAASGGGAATGASADAGSDDAAGGARDEAAAPPEEDEDDGSSLTLFKASGQVDDGPLPQVRKPAAGAAPAAARAGAEAPGSAGRRPTGPWGRPLAVPAARKRARELGVPLEQVTGSGPHGRIRVGDVETHGAAPAAPASRGGSGVGAAGAEAARVRYEGTPLRPAPDGPAETRVPMRGVRRLIAKQMLDSHLSTVRTLHVDEADVSRLVALRRRLKPRAEARGVSLSYLPFVMKALTAALAAYPMLNARMDEEAGEIVRYRDVHLGLAVATEQGLVVPVIRDASRRTVLDLAAETGRLARAARDGRLTPEEVRGGTFSVTNIGSIGGLFSMPIINAPEAAILGVHSIKKRPVVLDDDTIAARSMLYLSVSFDHRLVDGAEVAAFTNHLIDVLEEPEALLLDA